MISDINDVCTANPDLNIMSKIKNFMTDRSATEEKTNRILMNNSNNNTINSFKCSVHPLIQFWDVCDKSIKEIEKGENFKLRDGDKNRKDTYISILLNSVSKLFYKDGSGDPTMSNVYLKSQGPYWKAASDKKTPIEMGHIYTRLIDVLDNIVKSPSLLYDNHIKLFFGPEKDCHDVQDIFTADENRDQTELFISRLCFVIMEKAKKLFSDFLCGGKFFNADDDLKTTARICPSNNITVERLMGKLDSAIKQSPNSSVGAIETKIVYNNNKTQNWLDSKSNSDKNILLKTAIKNRKQRIESKEKQVIRKSDKKATVKKTIEENGIWNFEIELETEIDKLRTKTEKIKALKTQINLYKDDQVLDISKIDKNLLIFSKKGKPLSVLELAANLRKLIFHRNPFNDPESLVNKEIVHTWEDDNTSEQTCWNGRLQSYQNQEFEVKYWKENEELEEGDLYNLSVLELKEDFQGKLLTFKGIGDYLNCIVE
ncbi:unnamed protein product [Mytilus coruscus]|uniref:Uncharacterized protein n=1 Tax=Mytilus coruscus TaxID=42192 RepID=A0A6J8DEI0_MYTCO|nr:unnamed protein product [Mytilus coruscus]